MSARSTKSVWALWLLWFGAATAQAGGDVSNGANVYKIECAECHSVRDGKNKKGPSLFAVVGRQAASLNDVVYSDALKATGWVWTDERLRAYLSTPVSRSNPGGKMKYDGLQDAGALDDLISYLRTVK